LAAWRAGVIVNSLLGRDAYPTRPCPPPLRWTGTGLPVSASPGFDEAEL
jgi:hypothetical protein